MRDQGKDEFVMDKCPPNFNGNEIKIITRLRTQLIRISTLTVSGELKKESGVRVSGECGVKGVSGPSIVGSPGLPRKKKKSFFIESTYIAQLLAIHR